VFNWEIKAHVAQLGGGHVPPGYFRDESRAWSHPSYPQFLPMCELWIYSWTGSRAEWPLKFFAVLFYPAAAALLFSAGRRISGKDWRGTLAAVLLFFAPMAAIGPGGAASGWADFPLATFFLAALACVIPRENRAPLPIFAACCRG